MKTYCCLKKKKTSIEKDNFDVLVFAVSSIKFNEKNSKFY